MRVCLPEKLNIDNLGTSKRSLYILYIFINQKFYVMSGYYKLAHIISSKVLLMGCSSFFRLERRFTDTKFS